MEKVIITEKKVKVEQIASDFQAAQSVSVIEYRGLSVSQLEALRNELRKEEVEMHVLKNTLVQKAAESLGLSELDSQLTGPNAYVFSKKDAVSGPKVLVKFARKHEKLIIKGGVIEGKVVDEAQVKTIAQLPNKEGMLSMLLGCLTSPIRGFALAVKAIAEKQEQHDEQKQN